MSRSPRVRDMEKSQSVRFGSVQYMDDPRTPTDAEMAARPRLIQHRRSWRTRIISPDAIPWVLSCIFASTTIMLLLERPDMLQYGTYETAFTTDLQSLEKVPLELKRFGGSPLFDESGAMYIPEVDETASWPDNLDFTSNTKEADHNWLDLLEDRYFSISEEEATEAWGDDRHLYIDRDHGGGYTATLDAFHTLNCLNDIRMALRPDSDAHHGLPVDTSEARTSYCLDILRQHIQCYGSTTLVPTQYRPTARLQYSDADQDHVCRDFAYLHTYVQRRGPEGDLYVPRNAAGLGLASGLDEVEIKVVEGEVPA